MSALPTLARVDAPVPFHSVPSLPARPSADGRNREVAELARVGMALRLLASTIAVLMLLISALGFWATQGFVSWTILFIGIAGLAVTAFCGVWLSRSFVVPAIRATKVAAKLGQGDLTHAIDPSRGGELGALFRSLEEVRTRLFSVVSEVRAGTTSVAANASQVTRDNQALAERTQTQADSLAQTAATMEEMTSAVRQNADVARQANTLARSAMQRAEQGRAVVTDVVHTMQSISDSSRSVRDIVGVIDGIVFQTNILALNAAVEAARAGEQGRGFAVVAGEVRTLAQRCAASAREIRELVASSSEEVAAGGKKVDEAGQAITEIVEEVRHVAELMAQIDAATREQTSGIESINEAVARIDHATQANSGLVDDAAQTANALHGRALALMKGVATFRLGEREHGSADEAMALVQRACEFHQSHGRAALIADVNKLAQGRFVDRDLYLMVIGRDDNVFLAHGNNPRTLGQGPKSKDADGKRFVATMTETARNQGQGWVEYKWAHPVTNEVQTKATFVKLAGDVVVACGVYR